MLTTTKVELSLGYHSPIYRKVQSKVKKFTISTGYAWRKAGLFAGFRVYHVSVQIKTPRIKRGV